eukprot:3784068-Amphidinium_carterae.1
MSACLASIASVCACVVCATLTTSSCMALYAINPVLEVEEHMSNAVLILLSNGVAARGCLRPQSLAGFCGGWVVAGL